MASSAQHGAFAPLWAIAPSRPNFWDPAGPPALTTHCNAYIPEVRCCSGEASGCRHDNVLFDEWHNVFLILSLLLTCLCFTPLWLCILWQFVREPNMIHGTVCSHYILFHQCQWIFVLIKWLCSCLFDVIYSRSRRPCKCLTAARKIGNRRFCRPRRGQRYHRRYLSKVVHFPCLCNAVACAISVACFNIDRNQAMHSKYGNGKAGRGKGSSSGKAKGKGGRNGPPWAESTPQETLLIEDVATQVERVLPEKARLRMQSQLHQAEWNCPICA